MTDFQSKCVLVTGAAGALGFAVARRFADAGARLALFDLAEPALAARAAELGGGHAIFAVDLGDAAAVRSHVRAARETLGGLDIVCNIAGGFRMGPAVHETPPELWRLMLDMNAGTLLNVVAAAVPLMLAGGTGGKIVNVGAMAALSGKANMAAYVAAKSAVIRLTESMAAELREQGINVNCVLPSIIDTPANRADMPKADFSRWVAPAALAD
ncbi:MAG: SDR family NAD(P)-dependent oxidoreductase, partial [Rhodospirillaceae bacterium]|nr:SDR family NAD(P)-dependent oxidoreductase [Rhodospirillaceae bacterium]